MSLSCNISEMLLIISQTSRRSRDCDHAPTWGIIRQYES